MSNTLTIITFLQKLRKYVSARIFRKKFLAVIWRCRKPLLLLFLLFLLCDLVSCFIACFYLFDSKTPIFLSISFSFLLATSVILEKIYNTILFNTTEEPSTKEIYKGRSHATFFLIRFALECLIILFILFNVFAVLSVYCVLFSGANFGQTYNTFLHFKWLLQEYQQNLFLPFYIFILATSTYFSPQIVVYLSGFSEN